MKNALVVSVLFVLIGTAVSEDPSYLVLVPSVIRQGRIYDVSVQTFNAKGSVTVTAEILDKRNNTFVSNTETSTENQFTVSMKVPVTDLEFRHVVRVQGSGAIDFFNETFVSVSRKTVIILIQTDKAIYKPGQTVRFRCMAVYSDLKPYLGKFEIQILDPKRNKMAQWTNVKGPFGVFGDDFPLASAPPLGSWTIICSIKTEESRSKFFSVEEFVLPKVEVGIEMPSFFHESRIPLVATVFAKYTFGQPLSGTVKCIVSIRYGSKNYRTIIRTANLEDGKKDIKLTKEDIESIWVCSSTNCGKVKPIDMLRGRTFNITAVITDDVTGDQHVVTKFITMQYNLFRILFLEVTPRTFKDGLKWTGFVQLTLPDGSPPLAKDVKDKKMNVTFEFRGREVKDEDENFEISFKRTILQRYEIPKSGIVTVEIEIPKGMSACEVRAVFGPNRVSAFRSMEKYVSRDDVSLQISMPGLNGTIMPGDDVTVFVDSTVNINRFYYMLISKGRIVKQDNRAASGKTNQFTVTFDASLAQKTAPSARFVVWFMTDDHEVIVDSLDFSVKGAFANEVTMSFSEDEVKPGDDVSLVVNTRRNSFVGLLAVDQSILLLKKGNDITQNEVLNELRGFNSGRRSPIPYFCRYCFFPVSLGGQDATEVFENAGVQVMSDTHVHHIDFFDHGCYGQQQRFFGPVFKARAGAAADFEAAPAAPPPQADQESAPPELVEPDRVRDLFPETWIWTDDVSGNDGKVTLTSKAPDTITSWVASAFSMNEEFGLGIAEEETTNLVVFKAFFAQIDLPFSAIRGEALEVKVLVFNFLKSTQKVTITLEKPPNDEFLARKEGEKKFKGAKEIVQNVDINPNDGVELSFWIKPEKLGQVPVEVKAQSFQAADALRRMLLVEPEGVPCSYTKTFFIGVEPDNDFEKDAKITFPKDVIDGSQRVVFSAIGDIMGPTMRNLDRLLRMPYGCGEQNMLTFAPNIFVLDYLKATNQLDKDIAKQAKLFMRKGYQNQLRFQRSDGSFSAFGDRDQAGSTWLTAFVIRSFERAKPYTTIEQNIINRGLQFILRQQTTDGKFDEPPNGRTIHTDMQGGASEGTALTAYILITLIELEKSTTGTLKTQVNNAIKKTLDHLVVKLPRVKKDVYAMALITYAFTLYGHQKADEAYGYFNALAEKDPIAGTIHWQRNDPVLIVTYFWRPPYIRRPSNSIEMTGYGACISLMRKDRKTADKIIKWLSSQRNSFGGYRSTQDTVVGIDALAKFAADIIPDGKQRVDVTVEEKGTSYDFETITKNNFDVLQQREIDTAGPKATVKAKGNGAALVQMSVFYHKKELKDITGFKLTVTSYYLTNGQLKTRICFKYTVGSIPSGMVVVEINQLTGHVPITAFLLSQYRRFGLKRWEFLRSRKLVLYFDEARDLEICIDIFSFVTLRVENLQQAVVTVYSYYRLEVSDTKLYLPGGSDEGGVQLPFDCKKNFQKCDFAISSSGKGKSSFVKKKNIQLSLPMGEVDEKDFAVFSTPEIAHTGSICVEAFAELSSGRPVDITFVADSTAVVSVPVTNKAKSLGKVDMQLKNGRISISLGGKKERLAFPVKIVFSKFKVKAGRC